VEANTRLSDVLLQEGLVESVAAFRRLIEQGAIKKNGEIKIDDPFTVIEEDVIYKVGKHKFIQIKKQ
jgi:tyrosyl-tRNA synthetase